MAPIAAMLLKQGLGLLGNAVLTRGKDVVEEKLGVKLDGVLEGTASPADLENLKKLEFQHEEWLIEAGLRRQTLELKEAETYIGDTQNARGMQAEALRQGDQFSKRFVYYFAIAIFTVTSLYIAAITFGSVPEKNLRFADTILGFLLGTLLTTIINFFYGTSKGSKEKDQLIDSVMKKLSER